MSQETVLVTFVVIECARCHIQFGVYSDTVSRFQKDGSSFYCPNGHSNWYGESDASKLQRALDASRSNVDYYRNQAHIAEMSLRAKKGQITKLKRKIAAGVCPCCSEEFSNLKKHMEKDHPDFVPAPEKNGNEN